MISPLQSIFLCFVLILQKKKKKKNSLSKFFILFSLPRSFFFCIATCSLPFFTFLFIIFLLLVTDSLASHVNFRNPWNSRLLLHLSIRCNSISGYCLSFLLQTFSSELVHFYYNSSLVLNSISMPAAYLKGFILLYPV